VRAKKAAKRIDKVITWVIGIVGVGLLLYPLFSNLYYAVSGYVATERYERIVEESSKEERDQAAAYIAAYNEKVAREAAGQATIDVDADSGESVVDVSKPAGKRPNRTPRADGVPQVASESLVGELVGVLEIPQINQKLPIQASTSAFALNSAVGLVNGTSIPTTGKGVHSVIAGHRGLVHAEIFRHLDKLAIDDIFYISTNGEKFAYQVDKIEVVAPDVAADFAIDPDKNLVTLMTCTPYMVNSHRLLITGEQVPMPGDPLSGLPAWLVPLVVLLVAMGLLVLLALLLFWRGSARWWNVSLSDDEPPIEGSVFAVYAYTPKNFKPYRAERSDLLTARKGKNKLISDSLVSDADGMVLRKKLKRGHYYFVQLSVPEGYQLIEDPVMFQITLRRHRWGKRDHHHVRNPRT
jgi:sortase A